MTSKKISKILCLNSTDFQDSPFWPCRQSSHFSHSLHLYCQVLMLYYNWVDFSGNLLCADPNVLYIIVYVRLICLIRFFIVNHIVVSLLVDPLEVRFSWFWSSFGFYHRQWMILLVSPVKGTIMSSLSDRFNFLFAVLIYFLFWNFHYNKIISFFNFLSLWYDFINLFLYFSLQLLNYFLISHFVLLNSSFYVEIFRFIGEKIFGSPLSVGLHWLSQSIHTLPNGLNIVRNSLDFIGSWFRTTEVSRHFKRSYFLLSIILSFPPGRWRRSYFLKAIFFSIIHQISFSFIQFCKTYISNYLLLIS